MKKKQDRRIISNTVVQIISNDNNLKGWIGCFVQVIRTDKYGIQGWVEIPTKNRIYVKLRWDEAVYVGKATIIPDKYKPAPVKQVAWEDS